MKDKRNCNNTSYPMYGGMIPPYQVPMFNPLPINTYENQINNLEQQLDLLDQRVTRLEKLNLNTNQTTYNKYNDSNYYMV